MPDTAQPLPDRIGAIEANLRTVRERIGAAARRAGRDPASVMLVAVSKGQPEAYVRAAIEAGQLVFGENRVQEAARKYSGLKAETAGLKLHLIGPLQTNKARQACALFDAIETLDREKLARALAELCAQRGHCPDLFIEVNTGEEPQKTGIAPHNADRFIGFCRDELKLPVKGLMCLPPQAEEPSPHFALLKKIAARNGITRLSMGMSVDFEVAIEFGATVVRIGTAIFGPRGSADTDRRGRV
jgi:pyridoxal phosphate enzyme (YggS family)